MHFSLVLPLVYGQMFRFLTKCRILRYHVHWRVGIFLDTVSWVQLFLSKAVIQGRSLSEIWHLLQNIRYTKDVRQIVISLLQRYH